MATLPDSFGGYHVIPEDMIPNQIKKWHKDTPGGDYMYYDRFQPLFCIKHDSEEKYIAICEKDCADGYESCDRRTGVDGCVLDGDTLEDTRFVGLLEESVRVWLFQKHFEARRNYEAAKQQETSKH